MNKTYIGKPADVKREWHQVDAKGRILGQVAVEAATYLVGKHRPTYTPHVDSGDYVVVINAAVVEVTGRKEQNKKYYAHSGAPGGLRTETVAQVRAAHPERLIEHAVKGMIPKNRLRDLRMRRLKVYPGAEHPHQSQFATTESTETKKSE